MLPLIARAFITLLMSPEQINDLKQYEMTLPPGRYLQGFELCRRYQIKAGLLDELRESKMLEYLREWEKINWKKNEIENISHVKNCTEIEVGKWCHCRTRQQEIHEWMDYINKNWHEPLPLKKLRSEEHLED